MTQIHPEFTQARKHMEAGQFLQVEAALDQGLRRHPGDPYGRFLLGTLQYHKRNYREAIGILEPLQRQYPDFTDLHINLGSCLCEVERLEEAAQCYEQVLTRQPDHYLALNNLGSVRKKQKRFAEAQQLLEQAIAVRPGFWLAHHNLGGVLFDRKRYAEAAAHYHAALADRRDPNVYASLIGALRHADPDQAFAMACEVAEQEQPGFALLSAFPILVESCQWQLVARVLPEVLRIAREQAYPAGLLQGLLLPLNKVDGVDAETLHELHTLWGRRAMEHIRALPPRVAGQEAARPLRIGYVSPDFRDHSVGLFIHKLLEHHDRAHFELYCYANSRTSDELTARIRASCRQFATIYNLTDEDLARKIREDGIDILVDLCGHTSDSRVTLFRYKPAPVQITYLGYPNTTGLETMDFRITDADSEAEQGTRYSEQLLYMPESFLCFGSFSERPLRKTTPARDKGHITFGSFNNVNKLTPGTIALWADILHRVEDSRLLIKSGNAAKEKVKENLYASFATHGIEMGRIELAGFCPDKNAHLDLYNQVDIALDTFPYNGTTTTCEALWMGVPVLTRRGELHAGRVSAAILKHIGIEDTITDDAAAFVARAVALAANPDALDELRERIPRQLRASILCDPARFARQFETLLMQAWEARQGVLPWECAAGAQVPPPVKAKPMTVRIQGDIQVSVPNNIGLLTPYILLEQEDWFEAELGFVRGLLEEGMQVLDIGANYGLYSLTAARRVGERGRVWSFEPGSETAAYLRQSIAINQLTNLELIEAGMSDHAGRAQLSLHKNSELNAVVEEGASDGATDGSFQAIALESLDAAMERYPWRGIDFLKLDAEGFEERILAGGQAFFAEHSPLVLYEIKHGRALHLPLADRFGEMGYTSYRLVPGLNLLVPFDASRDADAYLLNLFCCKPDRAQWLEERGLLARQVLDPAGVTPPPPGAWVNWLARYPFAAHCLDRWLAFMECRRDTLEWAVHQQAMDFYVLAREGGLAPAERHAHLEAAYHLLGRLLENGGNLSNIQSFVRVAIDAGHWQPARDGLQYLLAMLGTGVPEVPEEPFLPVSDVFEWIEPGAGLGAWIKASILERQEKTRGYSSYFTGDSARPALEQLQALGFLSPEMERRRQLIAMRNRQQAGPQATPLLATSSPYNLNPGFWSGR